MILEQMSLHLKFTKLKALTLSCHKSPQKTKVVSKKNAEQKMYKVKYNAHIHNHAFCKYNIKITVKRPLASLSFQAQKVLRHFTSLGHLATYNYALCAPLLVTSKTQCGSVPHSIYVTLTVVTLS